MPSPKFYIPLIIALLQPVLSVYSYAETAPAPTEDKIEKRPVLKRISENGGEVLVDGSLRVFEPIMGRVFDLVETSTPVTPATNHVRLFAVQTGTFTVIKALFDDGVIKPLVNN